MRFVLVCFGSVQPDATNERADHAGDDDGEADSSSIHLFALKRHTIVLLSKNYTINVTQPM